MPTTRMPIEPAAAGLASMTHRIARSLATAAFPRIAAVRPTTTAASTELSTHAATAAKNHASVHQPNEPR